jgi:hypothetical protein
MIFLAPENSFTMAKGLAWVHRPEEIRSLKELKNPTQIGGISSYASNVGGSGS